MALLLPALVLGFAYGCVSHLSGALPRLCAALCVRSDRFDY
jgi:hypothetical protein